MVAVLHASRGAARAIAREVLLLACRRDAPDGSLQEAMQRLRHQGGEEELSELASRLRVLGLVLTRLHRAGALDAGDRAPGSLTRTHRLLRIQANVWDLERDRVIGLLTRSGLSPLLLKGAALRLIAYRESVERSHGDLDLLVRRREFDRARDVMLSAGYAPPAAEMEVAYSEHHFHLPVVGKGGFHIDLHWRLSRPESPFTLDTEGFLARSVLHVRTSGPAIRVPALQDLALHMASQNLEDSFSSLRRLVDLDRIVALPGGLDWDGLLEEAQRSNLEHVLTHSLTLARRVLGSAFPEKIERRLRLPALTRAHIALLRPVHSLLDRSGARRPVAMQLLHFWLLSSGRARLAHVVRMIRGIEDPMEWIWQHWENDSGAQATRLSRVVKLFKLMVYQAGLYLAAPFILVSELASGKALAPGVRRPRRHERNAPVVSPR
jgi:hypothetical protein